MTKPGQRSDKDRARDKVRWANMPEEERVKNRERERVRWQWKQVHKEYLNLLRVRGVIE